MKSRQSPNINHNINITAMVDFRHNCDGQIPLTKLCFWLKYKIYKVLFQQPKIRLNYRSPWFAATHWSRVTHICVSKLTGIGSDNDFSPGRCQAIIWTNAGILLIRTLGTNFSENLIEVHTFSFKKMHFKMSYGKCGHFVSASMCRLTTLKFGRHLQRNCRCA